ncbi:hypothetical protein, partial [Mesorhizobium sp. LNHC229A00]|uniref:hypothetical protein n=1 Tax=Mesorhizobium sp. LNHC229A00 TaxID=1287240 RepID=UPI001AEC5899
GKWKGRKQTLALPWTMNAPSILDGSAQGDRALKAARKLARLSTADRRLEQIGMGSANPSAILLPERRALRSLP